MTDQLKAVTFNDVSHVAILCFDFGSLLNDSFIFDREL